MKKSIDMTDKLLVATSILTGPLFEKSVVYVCQHDAEGAIGVIINRPTGRYLPGVLAELKIPANIAENSHIPILAGGPKKQDFCFILHKCAQPWRNSLLIGDDLALTSSKDILFALAGGVGPSSFLVVLGITMWRAGELEAEIAKNYWNFAMADRDLLFNVPANERWQAAMEAVGVQDDDFFAGYVGHA